MQLKSKIKREENHNRHKNDCYNGYKQTVWCNFEQTQGSHFRILCESFILAPYHRMLCYLDKIQSICTLNTEPNNQQQNSIFHYDNSIIIINNDRMPIQLTKTERKKKKKKKTER